MKVLIFGASGDTGRLLVSSGLQHSHGITAFVRNPSKLNIHHHENLKVVKGDVSDYKKVESALDGHDAAISALGAPTPLKRNPTLIKGIDNIVTAMHRQKVGRFIYQSFLGVSEYRSELGFVLDKVMPFVMRNVIKDHEAKEQTIVNSDLQWTIVRCSLLTDGPATEKYRDGEHITSSFLLPMVSRADVAEFMIRQLTDAKYNYKKPRLMY
ncbi:MAG TPA: NAD(P)-binding oxidoreductase [Chryseolinea sp.]